MICASADLVDGGDGVRFVVQRGGQDVAAFAVRYRGKAIQGDMRPTPPMVIAQEQCKAGNTTAGIGTLDRILRDGDITPPPR